MSSTDVHGVFGVERPTHTTSTTSSTSTPSRPPPLQITVGSVPRAYRADVRAQLLGQLNRANSIGARFAEHTAPSVSRTSGGGSDPKDDFGFVGNFFETVGGALNTITGGGAGEVWDVIDEPVLGAMTVIDKPRSFIVSGIQETGDFLQGEGFDTKDFWRQFHDNIGFNEVLDDWGVENIWARRILGFAGDVALDPVMYFPIIGPAAKAASVTARAFSIAGREGIEAGLRSTLLDIGTRATQRGAASLSKSDLAVIQAVDAADRLATQAGRVVDLDDLARAAANPKQTLRDAVPQVGRNRNLQSGLRMNVPLTGRVGRRLTNSPRAIRRGNAPLNPKSFPVLPQSATRFTPGGAYGMARGAIGRRSGGVAMNKLRELMGGQYQGFKRMMAAGDPESAYQGYWSLHGAVAGNKAAAQFAEEQIRALSDLTKELGDDNYPHLFDALGGSEEAIAALGPENMARLEGWRAQLRDHANTLVAGQGAEVADDFIKNLSTWSPSTYSREFQDFLMSKGDDMTPELADLRKQWKGGEQRVAKIRPGGQYLGKPIYAANDLANNPKGLTPRQQAEEIFAEHLANIGHDQIDFIFEQDFIRSAEAGIRATSDDVAEAVTLRILEEKGIAVNATDRLASGSAARRAQINAASEQVEAAKRAADARDGYFEQVEDSVRESIDRRNGRLADLEGQKAKLDTPVEGAERWRRMVDTVVDRAERAVGDARAARTAHAEEALKGAGANAKTLARLRKKIDATEGKLVRRMDSLERRRGKLMAEINDLRTNGEAVIARQTGAKMSDIGQATRRLRRKMAEVNQELDVLRAWQRLNAGEVDARHVAAGQLDVEAVKIRRQLNETTARTPEAAATRKRLRANLEEIEAAKLQANDAAAAMEQVLTDASGQGHTAYFREMAKTDEALERLEGIFGVKLTPDEANRLMRELKDNPQSAANARLQEAQQALGREVDELTGELGAELVQLEDDLRRLELYANTPVSVTSPDGPMIRNARNPENAWGVGTQGPYGPVLTTKTTSVPTSRMTEAQRRHPRTGRLVPERNLRHQVHGRNPRTYYGGWDDVNFDALEQGLADGLTPTPSWGEGWKEVAEQVRNGKTLRHAIHDVMPVTGRDPKALVKALLDDPTTLSGYSRQRMAKLFRDHNTARGFDSLAVADPLTGNWSLVPSDRRAIADFSDTLPDEVSNNLARFAEKQQAALHDNIAAKERAARELGADLEDMSGRHLDVRQKEVELEEYIGELERALDDAFEAGDARLVDELDGALEELERALEMRQRADEHLQTMRVLRGDRAPDIDVQIEATKAEIAYLGAVADGARNSPAARARRKQLDGDVRAAEKQLAALKAMPDRDFNELILSGERQVGWNSDRVIPEKIADVLSNRTKVTRGVVVDHIEKFMRAWRAGATFSWGFHIRNYGGIVINNIHAGIDPAMYGVWRRMQREYDRAFKGRMLRRGGGNMDPRAALDEAVETLKAKGYNPKAIEGFREIQLAGIAEGGQFDDLGLRSLRRPTVDPSASLPRRGYQRVSTVLPTSANFVPYRASRKIGGEVENLGRGALALDTWMKTGDIAQTQAAVHKFHFDYEDLSDFERNKLHRATSFYTWTRKNLPLQIEMLLSSPKAFQRYLAVQRNIEVGEHEQEILPDWQSRLGRIRLPWERNGSTVYLNLDTPFTDLTQMLDLGALTSGKGDVFVNSPLRFMINSSSPWVRLPIQKAVGKDTFTDAPFEGRITTIAPGWGAFPGLTETLEAVGLAYRDADGDLVMDAGWHHILQNSIPALNTAYRLHPKIGTGNGKREEEHRFSSWASYFLGAGLFINTESRLRNAEIARLEDMRDEADKQRKLGFEDRADELYKQVSDGYRELDRLYPREEG